MFGILFSDLLMYFYKERTMIFLHFIMRLGGLSIVIQAFGGNTFTWPKFFSGWLIFSISLIANMYVLDKPLPMTIYFIWESLLLLLLTIVWEPTHLMDDLVWFVGGASALILVIPYSWLSVPFYETAEWKEGSTWQQSMKISNADGGGREFD